MKKVILLSAIFAVSAALTGCLKHPSDNPDISDRINSFDFATTKEYTVTVDYRSQKDAQGKLKPIGQMSFSIYDQNPTSQVNKDGLTRAQFKGVEGEKYSVDANGLVMPAPATSTTLEPIYRAITDDKGYLQFKAVLPRHIEAAGKVWIYTEYGSDTYYVPEIAEVELQGDQINLVMSSSTAGRSVSRGLSRAANSSAPAGVKILGDPAAGTYGWDNDGVPLYKMAEQGAVPTSLFHNLMNLLPNTVPALDKTELFDKQTNIESDNPYEVNLVFVHDGGDFKSAVGYYVYDKANPPTTLAQLEACQKVLAFPNASYAYSGGNLATGDQVQLMYWDAALNGGAGGWTKTFPADKGVGFFMYPHAYASGTSVVKDWMLGTIYSHYGAAFQQQQQTILLRDEGYNKDGDWDVLVLTFEDLLRSLRTGWEDNDFNDVIFLVKVKKDPTGDIPEIPEDPDPDPKPDPWTNYVVYKGTLAYEDLWPTRGDYDMNDVVIEYYSVVMLDANNHVVGMVDSLTPRWSGAEFHSGFGYELNLPYSQYKDRVNISLKTNYNATSTGTQDDGRRMNTYPTAPRFSTDSKGFELRQDNLVFIVFDDIKPMVPDYNQYRTSGAKPKPAPQYYFRISTSFGDGNPRNDMTSHPYLSAVTPPYNPFIVVTDSKDVNGNSLPYYRAKEIHLPSKSVPNQYKPTKLAFDTDIARWFRAADDLSFPVYGFYFISNQNYPWAINIPVYNWNFPQESKKVDNATYGYSRFANWALTLGAQDQDWYLYPGSQIGPLGN